MKYLGCAYYPEYWGIDRLAVDAGLMQAAGINLVRIGEFAWSRLEPEEGAFTFGWLHQTIETLAAHDINVLMCTPSAAPPAWLTSAYPDVLLVRQDGRRAEHGGRRHTCPTSATYRSHVARITEQLSAEMAPHLNVIAWQIDNELGPELSACFCENCQSRFQAWLEVRYGSLAALNAAWRTGFWSTDYSDWRQVRLSDDPSGAYSSRNLDSQRFFSTQWIEFCQHQAAILRRVHPASLITTNGMGPIYAPIDYFQLYAGLDVACDDLYFDIASMPGSALAMNVFRSLKPGRAFWVTETGSGALDHNHPPHPDQFRAWAWSSWAHGAEAHLVFRWRTALSGQEQELQGILEHSGEPRQRYAATRRCFTEFARLRPELETAQMPQAQVAIIQDYNVLWGYAASRIGPEINYPELIDHLHRQFYQRNLLADILPPDRPLAGYQLIILPSLMMIPEDLAANLKAAVHAGAVVLAWGQIGMRDASDNYLSTPGPEHLDDLLGCRLHGGMYLKSFVGTEESLWWPKPAYSTLTLPVSGGLGEAYVSGVVTGWAGDLELTGAEALLTFAADAYQGQPAVVEHTPIFPWLGPSNGPGRAIYVAASRLDDSLSGKLLDYAIQSAGLAPGPQSPRHVEILERYPFTVLINHNPQPVRVEFPDRSWQVLLGNYAAGVAQLEPYGVCLLKR